MRKRRGAYGTWWRNLTYIVHLEDKDVDGRIILRWIYKKQDGGVNWIDLAQIRREWQVFVNTAMYNSFPYMASDFVTR